MSTNGKTLKFRAAKLKGFTVSIKIQMLTFLWKMSLKYFTMNIFAMK